MNPNQNKCTLDQLLEHAESQSLEDRQTRFRTERLEEFKGSEIYLDNASFLIELVEPLRQLLPTKEEFDSYAYGKPFPQNNDKTLEGMRRIKNPAIVMVDEARRCERDDFHSWSNMSDECWNGLLENVDFIKDFWEVNESANTLELAKAIILHTVLYDDGLKDEVFHKASEMVRIMTSPALRIMPTLAATKAETGTKRNGAFAAKEVRQRTHFLSHAMTLQRRARRIRKRPDSALFRIGLPSRSYSVPILTTSRNSDNAFAPGATAAMPSGVKRCFRAHDDCCKLSK